MTTRSDIAIVPIAPDYIEGFHRALDIVAREKRYLTLLEAPPLDQTRDFMLGLIAAGDVQVVALDGDEVVGWCDIRRHRFPAHAHRGTLGMGIMPSHRGCGLGRRLIDAALRRAREIGLRRIELDVHADNARAIALYERVGFLREGVVCDAACIDGVYRDAISMALIWR